MNRMLRRSRRRGAALFGLAAIIVLVGALSAAAVARSFHMAAHSGLSLRFLQAQAAAEGAAAFIETQPGIPREPLTVGPCTVEFGTADDRGTETEAPLEVAVHAPTGREVMRVRYRAVFATGQGGWTLRVLEKLP